MRIQKLLIALVFFGGLDGAMAQSSVKLWPGKVPGETLPKHPPVLRDTLKGVTRITDITDPDLLVYKPALNKDKHAAIIVSPGGGNKYLAVDLEGKEIATWLSSLGYTAFVLQYRVPMKQEGAVQDIQRAISLLKSQHAQWNIAGDKVGVMGFSAGGNLSARASTAFKERKYTPVDKIDSASCRPDFALLIYPGSLTSGDQRTLIPEIKPDHNAPNIFMFVASDDQYGMPLSLANALRDAKVKFELHVCPSGGHGYGLRKGNPAAETWPPLAEKWLNKFVNNQ